MSLTFVDVVLRYVFNKPVRGAFEITELMMVILIYAGLPLVSRHDMHVTTDLVDRFLARSVKRVLAAMVHLVCAAALLGGTWLMWLKARRTVEVGDTTANLQISLAPFVYLMCALMLATAIIHLVKALLAEPDTGGGGSV
jgi:TRAP-type C4-dicarboxylate transport system permease small subunit